MANFQRKAVESLTAVFPNAVFYKPTRDPVVALTIDDVPTPGEQAPCSTRWILDAIADHNQSVSNLDEKAQATFFAIGSHLNEDATLLPDTVAQGHEIGNHGLVDSWTVLQSERRFEEHFRRTHHLLADHVPDHTIRWYRPGRALYNPHMLRVLKRMEDYEPYFVLASMLPLDTFSATADPAFTAQYIAQHIFPGAILILHGGSVDRAKNAAATLKLTLADLRSRGYRVTTMSQLWDYPTVPA